MAGASSRASASAQPDDKMNISEVDITPIEASISPRRVRFPRDGKNCHQCRQTITDRVASCTSIKGKRRCRVNICRRCLHNRYAEDVDVVSNLTEWSCPKCRNICNCSLCRRKMGCNPTGILAPMAKENGFSSVHQFISSGQELPKRKYGESSSSCIPNNARKKLRVKGGNSKVIEDNSGLNSQSAEEPKEENRAIGSTEISDENENAVLVSRPQEKNIVEIGGEDYTSEDMEAALLFLECVRHFARGKSYQKENMKNQVVVVYLITTQMITAPEETQS